PEDRPAGDDALAGPDGGRHVPVLEAAAVGGVEDDLVGAGRDDGARDDGVDGRAVGRVDAEPVVERKARAAARVDGARVAEPPANRMRNAERPHGPAVAAAPAAAERPRGRPRAGGAARRGEG